MHDIACLKYSYLHFTNEHGIYERNFSIFYSHVIVMFVFSDDDSITIKIILF